MNIFKETYIELDVKKAKLYAKYFNEIFNVPISVFEDNNNRHYFIIPIPKEHPNKSLHNDMVEVFKIE